MGFNSPEKLFSFCFGYLVHVVFQLHWLIYKYLKVLQVFGQVDIPFGFHLFAQAVTAHFDAAKRHVEQRGYVFGGQVHFQVSALLLVTNSQDRVPIAQAHQVVFVHQVKVPDKAFPVGIMFDFMLNLILHLCYFFQDGFWFGTISYFGRYLCQVLRYIQQNFILTDQIHRWNRQFLWFMTQVIIQTLVP